MKKVSFCIPIKNRINDIKSTLRRNLDDNAQDSDDIEFIVICFDENDEVEQWVNANFQNELNSGYLRFYRETLDEWHFGIAKNAFKKHVNSKIYASLDGDNFTGYRGGNHIIQIFEKYNYNCIFHQFQGDWGDGTCGRVSLNAQHYKEFGYDDDFLPRQWDELDAMLTVMVNYPDVVYVSYEGISIIQKSHPFKRFLEENSIYIEEEREPLSSSPVKVDQEAAAVGAHDSNYVRDDFKLRYFSIYNHLLSFLKNSKEPSITSKYEDEIKLVQNQLFQHLDIELLRKSFLTCEADKSHPSEGVFLVSCVKNEPDIEHFYNYYKSLGVNHFFFVDDNSIIPLSKIFQDKPDVTVFKPKVGFFKISKVFWLKIIMDSFCEGHWVFTVDSDEYAEIIGASSLRNLVQTPDKDFFAGYMLDMFPSKHRNCNEYDATDIQNYQYYQFKPGSDKDFDSHNTSKWSYGEYTNYFYSIDIRYRLNNSFDSLRKFPLVKWNRSIIMNQGFHDLLVDGVKRKPHELNDKNLIVLRHFKLKTLFSSENMSEHKSFDGYHADTAQNLARLEEGKKLSQRICNLTPYAYKFINTHFFPTVYRKSLKVGHSSDCDIIFRQKNTLLPSVDGKFVYAYDIESACEFIREVTPFQKVKNISDDSVCLAID